LDRLAQAIPDRRHMARRSRSSVPFISPPRNVLLRHCSLTPSVYGNRLSAALKAAADAEMLSR
jgi:hypothetical protein